MAEAMIVERWHTLLSVLPTLSGDSVDNFVKQQCVAKETSLRGYKFFVESYIHDVQGMRWLRDGNLECWTCRARLRINLIVVSFILGDETYGCKCCYRLNATILKSCMN
jgi:hypothetical protein